MKGYFYYDNKLEYSKASPYMPGEQYPEYPYDDLRDTNIIKDGNKVYEAIRNIFIQLQLDISNVGKSKWNPLGEYIQPGQTILLKPNLVNHHNLAESDYEKGMDCLITHPSVVRCIFDYVYIALSGQGKIIIGDAPIQGCDFELLLHKTGYRTLIKYLQEKATDSLIVQAADLREVTCMKKGNKIIQKEREETEFGSKTIDLKTNSFFSEIARKRKLRVTGYAGKDTYMHHGKERNEYRISDAILDADVVINIPKPKTHRIAGYTGALKNMIGINARKEYLPHHQKGVKGSGSDEYADGHNLLKWMNSTGNDVKNYAIKKNFQKIAYFTNEFCRKIGRRLDNYEPNRKKFGMWHGNDTIWRTILDINSIVCFADKSGTMCKNEQRTILHIGDLVICGEREGPLNPSYKKVGGILFSESATLFDFFIVKIMGFDWKKFPVLVNAIKNQEQNRFYMQSNVQQYEGEVVQIKEEDIFHFIPTKGWMELCMQSYTKTF